MSALYTELFKDFLERNKDYMENDKYSIKNVYFNLIPKFSITNVDYSKDFDMYEMFTKDNEMKEIGLETEELFKYHLERTLDDIIINYVPKIKVFIDNFETLVNRKVKLNYSNTSLSKLNSNNENKDTHYFNPNSTDDGANSIDDVNKSDFINNSNGESEIIGEREEVLFNFKTNPEILEQTMKIENIYLECLHKFDSLFLGVL